MKKLIIIGFFCLFAVLAHAEVQVRIEPSQISLGESFRLILSQSNLQSGGVPDLTPLQKDFIILGTERRVNYSIINGQSQSSSEWAVSLQAQKEGQLTIPAIKIGSEQTMPMSINVTASPNSQAASSNSTSQQPDVFLTATVDKKAPYVNQQIIYKVSLYTSKQLLDAAYQGPRVENALLIPLGEEKRYQTQRNNVNYLVTEQNYAIFPQKSGKLTITSPTFTALIYDFNPQRIKTQDKTIHLNIQPIPKKYTGKIWLPAKQIQLTEHYENEETSISQGNTLIRTIKLKGVGVPAQLLPTINVSETDGFNVYPEKGADKNQIIQGELVAHTEIKLTYLFNKSGKITIPEFKLPWFNTETGKEEIATLAPKTIDVISSTAAATTSTEQQTVTKNQDNTLPASGIKETAHSISINWAWIAAAFFALAWAFTLILWKWPGYNRNTKKAAYKRSLKNLHGYCVQGDPQGARDALLEWARLHWPDAHILNLTDLIHLVPETSLKKQVHILSQALYKNKEKTLWCGNELWRTIQAIKQNHVEKKSKAVRLPPMNP